MLLTVGRFSYAGDPENNCQSSNIVELVWQASPHQKIAADAAMCAGRCQGLSGAAYIRDDAPISIDLLRQSQRCTRPAKILPAWQKIKQLDTTYIPNSFVQAVFHDGCRSLTGRSAKAVRPVLFDDERSGPISPFQAIRRRPNIT